MFEFIKLITVNSPFKAIQLFIVSQTASPQNKMHQLGGIKYPLHFHFYNLLHITFYSSAILLNLLMGNIPYFRNILIAFFLFLSATWSLIISEWKVLSLIFLLGISATIPTNSPDEKAAMVEGGTAWSNRCDFEPYVKLYIRPIMRRIIDKQLIKKELLTNTLYKNTPCSNLNCGCPSYFLLQITLKGI